MSNPMMKKIHVLLALRDDVQLKSYAEFLTREGFRVTTSASALACWAELECERPDVVVMEEKLSSGGGEGVLARLDEEPETRGIPVILLVAGNVLASRMRSDSFPKRENLANAPLPHDLAKRVRGIGQQQLSDRFSRSSAQTRTVELQAVGNEII